jgi:hypothetical protein
MTLIETKKALVAAVLLGVGVFGAAHAAVPDTIDRLGRAFENISGLPLEGDHQITVRLYDDPSDVTTDAIYIDTKDRSFDNGFFLISVPVTPALRQLLLNIQDPLLMGVQIDDDSELSPPASH